MPFLSPPNSWGNTRGARVFRPLTKHVAGLSRIDVALHVLLEQQAPLFELRGRARDRLHVSGVACIALLQRKARVAGRKAASLGGLERDPLTGRFAAVHV